MNTLCRRTWRPSSSVSCPHKLLLFCRLSETRSGDICNACVLLVKRWKKLPVGTKKNWNHVSCSVQFCDGVFYLDAYEAVKFLGLGCWCTRRSQPKNNLQAQKDKVHIKESTPQSDQQTAKGAEAEQWVSVHWHEWYAWHQSTRLTLVMFFFRLRCPQHHLQCLSSPVSKLQSPVRWRLWHWTQPRIQPLSCFLLPGLNLLEEVPVHLYWRFTELQLVCGKSVAIIWIKLFLNWGYIYVWLKKKTNLIG